MDYLRLAAQLTRAARGRRSQAAHSKWLGFKSNVAYAWESGRASPTAAELLAILKRKGLHLRPAYARFYQRVPAWLELLQPETREGVAAFLNDLRGRTSVLQLAKQVEQSRFTVSRWLSGETEIRLPEFLQMIEVTSLRLLDFLAVLTDPAELPEARDAWRNLENSRRAAYDMPWSQAVLRMLEIESYKRLPRHEPGWIGKRLAIAPESEEEALMLLRSSGQVVEKLGKLAVVAVTTTDTRRDPERAWHARIFWSRVALERLEQRADGLYWHNVFSVSEADYERIKRLHAAFFQEVRTIVAQSAPEQRVVLMNLQLIPLSTSEPDGYGQD